MKQYRSEWKYRVSDAELQQVRERVSAVMDIDSHAGDSGKYIIHSLYFDDLRNSCAYENTAGVSKRFKYRLRYYGSDPGTLHLERKEKENTYCHKLSCSISFDEYEKLAAGNAGEFIWDEDRPLLRTFARDIITRGFEPKVIVNYEREAFVEPVSNVRITCDRSICASDETGAFLSGDYLRVPVLPGGQHILEVKFDDVLPSYIKNAIQANPLTQQAFSKYYMSRLAIDEMFRFG